jgi:ABC-type antimicrobial peptide transport system ATPase subunit
MVQRLVVHIPTVGYFPQFSKLQIRMAAAEQKRDVATAEPLLAGFCCILHEMKFCV